VWIFSVMHSTCSAASLRLLPAPCSRVGKHFAVDMICWRACVSFVYRDAILIECVVLVCRSQYMLGKWRFTSDVYNGGGRLYVLLTPHHYKLILDMLYLISQLF